MDASSISLVLLTPRLSRDRRERLIYLRLPLLLSKNVSNAMNSIPKDTGKPIIAIKIIMISKSVIRTTSSLRSGFPVR